jgi:hypothetical protein
MRRRCRSALQSVSRRSAFGISRMQDQRRSVRWTARRKISAGWLSHPLGRSARSSCRSDPGASVPSQFPDRVSDRECETACRRKGIATPTRYRRSARASDLVARRTLTIAADIDIAHLHRGHIEPDSYQVVGLRCVVLAAHEPQVPPIILVSVGANIDLSLLPNRSGAERRPIDRPIHGADQDGAAHDIAKGDRNEVMDDSG